MPVSKSKKVILLDSSDYLSKELKANDVEYSYVSLNGKSFDEAVLWLNAELYTPDYQQNDLQFIINVNLLFKGGNYEEQKGVDLYRAILHILHDRIETISFVFYSPLPVALSAKFKPSNSVLLHLPYIELPVEDVVSVTKILELSCPLFNNSSENLLSGFYLTGVRPIDKNQNIFIVDDQYLEWEKTLSLIFAKSNFYSFKRNSREEYKKLYHSLIHETAANEVNAEFEEFVSKSDLIISDLYLTENHETGTWKTMSESRAISGFQIIERIKKINEFIPLVLFSTSNRARNIYLINTRNINGWCIKDNRSQILDYERKEFFYEYLNTCNYATTEFDNKLKDIWCKFKYIEANVEKLWWYKMVLEYNAKEVSKISSVVLRNTEQSLKAFRRYNNQRRDISKAAGSKFAENQLDEFSIHSIIVQLFKSIELVYLNTNFSKERKKANKRVSDSKEKLSQFEDFQDDVSRYLYIVRCNSAHGALYHNINSNNALCFFIYTIYLLSLNDIQISEYIKSDKIQKIGFSHERNYQLLNNISFYNHPASLLTVEGKKLLRSSIIDNISKQNHKWFAIAIINSGLINFVYNSNIDESEALRYKFNENNLIEFEISESLNKSGKGTMNQKQAVYSTNNKVFIANEEIIDPNPIVEFFPDLSRIEVDDNSVETEEVLMITYSEIEQEETINADQELTESTNIPNVVESSFWSRLILFIQNLFRKL